MSETEHGQGLQQIHQEALTQRNTIQDPSKISSTREQAERQLTEIYTYIDDLIPTVIANVLKTEKDGRDIKQLQSECLSIAKELTDNSFGHFGDTKTDDIITERLKVRIENYLPAILLLNQENIS